MNARSGILAWLRPDPAGRLLVILTVPIFGAAFFVYGVEGWGRWTAIALLGFWVLLALVSAVRQARRAGVKPEKPPPQPLWLRAVKVLLLCALLLVSGYPLWLDHAGAPDAVVRNWRDGAQLMFLIVFLLIWLIEWVALKIQSRS